MRLTLPGLSVALILAGIYWFLDVALDHYSPGSPGPLSSLFYSDPATAKRIVCSILIGLAGTAAIILVGLERRRVTLSSNGNPLVQVSTQHDALLEATFDGILLITADGKIHKANSTAASMFGAPPAVFAGLAAGTFFSISEAAIHDSATGSSQPVDFDPASCNQVRRVTALGLDGRSFPAEIRASEIDYDGTRHFVLCVRETTAESDAKAASQRFESRYLSLFNNMLDGAYQSTEDGRILAVNPALVRLLGYATADELRATVSADQIYHHEEQRLQVIELLNRTRSVRNLEIELLRKDGTVVTVLANIRAIPGDLRHGTVYEGTVSDISDVVAARLALQRSEEQFRAMTEHALDIVTVLDERGNTIYVSPSGSRVSGLLPGDTIDKNVLQAIHRDDLDSVKAILRDAFASPGSPHKFTFRFLRHDGQVLFLESVGSAYRGYDGQLRAVIHSRDVTERMRTEAQLQQAQKMQAVGQLTGGIAHDFNNLLTVVVGNLQLLEEKVDGREEISQVQMALRASMQGAELTRRLLAFSRRQFLEPKVIDVNELLQGMEPIMRRSLNESAHIITECADDLWPAKVDPAQLESALLNLAINAGDSMSYDGALAITTSNCVLSARDVPSSTTFGGGDYVCITVSDKGSGMSEEVLQRAIEPFFSTKDRDGSSGLGLSMVYGFVTQSGGYLQIDSKPNKGTDIRIYLPRAMPSNDELAATTTSLEIPGGTETIMVVDDNQDVRDSASALLRSLGYTVIAANHGRSALHLLQTERIQLLFSDVMMPQLAGFELANVARQFQPRIRVLLTTGYTGSSESPMDETFGGFNVLRKPYTKRDLAIRIRHQLDD